MKPTIVLDSSEASVLIHWLVLEKECPLELTTKPVAPVMVRAPYYEDGEILIYDHQTLVQFLQERYPGEQLLPVDPISRAQIRQACMLIRDPDDIDVFTEVESILDTGSEYMTGDQFTLLDIYVGAWLNDHYTPDNSSVRSYWKRISERNAFRIATS